MSLSSCPVPRFLVRSVCMRFSQMRVGAEYSVSGAARCRTEQIVAKLREAERLQAPGLTSRLADVGPGVRSLLCPHIFSTTSRERKLVCVIGTAEGFGYSFVWAAAVVGVVVTALHAVVVKQPRMRCRGRQ